MKVLARGTEDPSTMTSLTVMETYARHVIIIIGMIKLMIIIIIEIIRQKAKEIIKRKRKVHREIQEIILGEMVMILGRHGTCEDKMNTFSSNNT